MSTQFQPGPHEVMGRASQPPDGPDAQQPTPNLPTGPATDLYVYSVMDAHGKPQEVTTVAEVVQLVQQALAQPKIGERLTVVVMGENRHRILTPSSSPQTSG